jgi:hypothetical protein
VVSLLINDPTAGDAVTYKWSPLVAVFPEKTTERRAKPPVALPPPWIPPPCSNAVTCQHHIRQVVSFPWKKVMEGLRRFEKVLTLSAEFDEIWELPMFKVPRRM